MKKRPVCAGCGVFRADAMLGPPGSREPLCYPCAHGALHHGDVAASCACGRGAIYPVNWHADRGIL